MTLAALNASDRDAFVAALGWIFEDSPWVAERVWPRRPFGSRDALLAAMIAEVARAPRTDQLALLRAHPDLGARARMSEASIGEQAGAGLDRLADGDVRQLQALTAAYRERFGFPFLLAVKGRSTRDVLEGLARRLPQDAETEWREALEQVYRIASFRLHDAVE